MSEYFRNNNFPTVGQVVESLSKLDPSIPMGIWTGSCCERRECTANYYEISFFLKKDAEGKPILCEVMSHKGFGGLVADGSRGPKRRR